MTVTLTNEEMQAKAKKARKDAAIKKAAEDKAKARPYSQYHPEWLEKGHPDRVFGNPVPPASRSERYSGPDPSEENRMGFAPGGFRPMEGNRMVDSRPALLRQP